MIFADVIIDISVKSLDKTFQYRVPDEFADEIEIGSLVNIPFGNGNRLLEGYVIGLSGEAKFDISKTKSIAGIVKQGVVAESHLLSLAYWIKQNYGSTMSDAIKAVMPVRREVKEQVTRIIYPSVSRSVLEEYAREFERKHNAARVRMLRALLMLEDESYNEGIDYGYAIHNLKMTASVLNGLKEKGIINISAVRDYRNPVAMTCEEEERPELNRQQQKIVDDICMEYDAGVRGTYLIHGVTGSGKTEVYMNIIERVIAKNKQVIMLIPEIALTFQTVNRFYKRFGDKVSVIHSRLSAGEKYDQFIRAKKGEIDIMIGPRSALFTPFANLGLIVMDEEHETSYKSDMPPKYNAREVAVHRAGMLGASVILGSATPSVEAYYKAVTGEYKLFKLTERAGGASLPEVNIVDLRKELEKKNYSIFSTLLADKIRDRLSRKEQVIIFINRRGYAGFVSCRKCGEAIGCPHCSVSLKPHMFRKKVDRLRCHYCGHEIVMPSCCPSCGSKYIGTFGIGTQQVEEAVLKNFPGVRTVRMDADTTTGKEGHEKQLKLFAEGKADVLIGTQMIVKGHDFPNVTLVGIIAADLSLNVDDYKAAERTYQLVVQAAGRAGRADKAGEVVLQTYKPEHYSIVCAARQDYEKFYEYEIAMREMLQYPPISNILGVLVYSEKEESAAELSGKFAEFIRNYGDIQVLGPTDAPLAKVKDIYRKIIYVKCSEHSVLCGIKDRLEEFKNKDIVYKDCGVHFEML